MMHDYLIGCSSSLRSRSSSPLLSSHLVDTIATRRHGNRSHRLHHERERYWSHKAPATN